METNLIPSEPTRVKQFAVFFKNYMSIWSVIVAALPIPVTMLDFIPTYSAHTKTFSLYTSLLCFLLLGFIFYNRHQIGSILFTDVFRKDNISRTKKRIFNWLPGILIILCIVSIFGYHFTIKNSINTIEALPSKYAQSDIVNEIALIGFKSIQENKTLPVDSVAKIILKKSNERVAYWIETLEQDRYKYNTYSEFVFNTTDIGHIPNQWLLIVFYLAIFIFSEAAFILMALKEYLQDLLELDDVTIINSYFNFNTSN